MIDLFENILTGEKVSKYKTNHFHMIVDCDIQLPNVEEMNDSSFGTFIHEYVHYIQHITTLFGIRMCTMFHRISIIYRKYIEERKTVTLPLRISEIDKNCQAFIEHWGNVSGSKSCGHNVDGVDITIEDIENAKVQNTAVKISSYDFENDRIYEKDIQFGYICVIESMAHLIQQCFVEENVNHPVVPYLSAEHIIHEIYPQIYNDKKLIASICFCALHWDNPGVGFFEVVEIAKANPNLDGIELYRHIARDYAIKNKEGVMPRFRLIQEFLEDFKLYLSLLLGTKLDYYQNVINSCIKEAGSSSSKLLEVIYNEDLNDRYKIFTILTNTYGYPFIEARNAVFLPNSSFGNSPAKPYLETSVLVGWELLITRFLEEKENKACSRLPFCQAGIYLQPEKCAVTEKCTNTPWLKKEVCIFTQCLKYFRFDNKTFEESK